MENDNLTLKELADELHISKSYIDKIIRTLSMHTELKKDGNKYVLNPRQQSEIKAFISSKKSHTKSHTKTHDSMHTDVDSETIFLREQLTERNKEIEDLHKILDQQQQLQLKTQNLLDQQQQLTLQSNKQIEKLQLQLETVEQPLDTEKEEDSNKSIKEILTNQEQLLNQLKEKLEQKEVENTQLKQEIIESKQDDKKGFWARLFS